MVRVIGSQLYNNRGPGGCLISFVLVQGALSSAEAPAARFKFSLFPASARFYPARLWEASAEERVQGEKKEIIHALLEIKTQILNYVCFMITRPSAKLEQFGFAFPFFC